MTSSRSRTRAKPGRCPARRPQSRRPAIQEGRPCSFPKKETLHQPLVQGQTGASAPYRGWHHATPQHCLGDNVVGWPLSYQGPCFQAAVTYGLPCPAVRDSRAWERRCIYCLIAGRFAPYCAASRTGGTHTGTPAKPLARRLGWCGVVRASRQIGGYRQGLLDTHPRPGNLSGQGIYDNPALPFGPRDAGRGSAPGCLRRCWALLVSMMAGTDHI